MDYASYYSLDNFEVAPLRKFGKFVDGRTAQPPAVKRWDGAARTYSDWDNIRRDPELWLRNGNCLVHLYEQGQSRRGPSFKVPFSALLEAKCHPLIQRFIAWEGGYVPSSLELNQWSRKNPTRKVELYIPPPPTTDKTQAFHYHLATRNLFAWVFRRSIVGASLGGACIELLHSMHEFRAGTENNVADMMDYFDEEGYLGMTDQPNHALAMLQLAEFFEFRELYTRAFAHCVGMSDRLSTSLSYQELSATSRKLIREARSELENRLSQSSDMLKTFLDDELSESRLGVSSGARAHLERFRSFLLSFYAAKLGYYPPGALGSGRGTFDAHTYRTMRQDFEALYQLLVDESYTSSQTMPTTAYGGICTIQLVHSFDLEYSYKPLQHPLPLIPELGDSHPRRMSWLPGLAAARPDRRTTAYAALTNASNLSNPGVSQNDLVRAYQRFEEDSIMLPNKSDRQEKVSIVDARKVRWILVYAIYQVLREATNVPPEVELDVGGCNYSLAVLTSNIPPWKKARGIERILRRQTLFVTGSFERPAEEDVLKPKKIEIRPDVDYFALTHKHDPQGRRDSGYAERRASETSRPSRSNSLTQAISRSSTIQRSMRMFRSPSITPPPTVKANSRQAYHEIVVHGYGNGTNNVSLEGNDHQLYLDVDSDVVSWSQSSGSCGSKVDDLAGSSPSSMVTNVDTIDSSPVDTPPLIESFVEPVPLTKDVRARRQKRRDVVSMVARSVSGRVNKRRPMSAIWSDGRYPENVEDIVEQRRTQSFTRYSMRRRETMPSQQGRQEESQPRRAESHERCVMPEDPDWAAMQMFMESPGEGMEKLDDDMLPAWEQYADLGGLTDMS